MSVKLIPYLVMDGNAREAIDFYQKALDATSIMVVTFADMPQNPDFPLPSEAKDRIAHAMLKVGESNLMFSDTFPGDPLHKGDQVTICISTDSEDKSRKFYDALRQDGRVNMELQNTDFSPAYANVTDKYGVTFQIFTEARS